MDADRAKEIIEAVDPSKQPRIKTILRAEATGSRLGVFASSFNPPTTAHIELIERAADTFKLNEVLALAGKTNADKLEYECSLDHRVAMLTLALAANHRVSIGLSSHAFYVDIIDALEGVYQQRTDLHFIVGFDTFERVLDLEDRYTTRYHRKFRGRIEALEYLFARSSFIVAGRAGAGLDSVRLLIEREPAVPAGRISYLDFPADLAELSGTEVRKRRRDGKPITGLVPPAIDDYIREHALYAGRSIDSMLQGDNVKS